MRARARPCRRTRDSNRRAALGAQREAELAGVHDRSPGCQHIALAHREWGYTFGWLVLVILILALVGRLSRRLIGMSVALLVLFFLQSIFVAVRADYPAVAALHPFNGFLVLLIAFVIGRDGLAVVRADRADPPPV